jgi:tetratricopeptide (TPR) repeat protein
MMVFFRFYFWRWLLCATLLVVLLFALAGQSQAQASGGAQVRPAVAQALQGVSKAMQDKNFAQALAMAKQALAVPELTPQERYVVEYNLAGAAIALKDHAQTVQSLDYVLTQSTPIEPAPKLALLEAMVFAGTALKDDKRVIQWAPEYRKLNGPNRDVQLAWLTALSRQGQHQQAVQLWDEYFKQDIAANSKPLEPHLRAYANSQLQSKNNTGYFKALLELLRHYPKRDYWRDAAVFLDGASDFNSQYAVDVYVLMQGAQTFDDAADYLGFAQTALKAGLPKFALQSLDTLQARALKLDAKQSVQAAQLRGSSQKAAQQDTVNVDAALPANAGGQQLAALGDVALSQSKWGQAAKLYAQALSAGGVRNVAQTRLRQGAALKLAGEPSAKEVLEKVSADSSAERLAQLWLLWKPAP